MEIRLNNPSLIPELMDFIGRAAGVAVVLEARNGAVEVSVPGTLDHARTRRQVCLYVAAWEGLHPGVAARVQDGAWSGNAIDAISAAGVPG